MSFFDRLVVSLIPLVPRFLVRRISARYIAGTTLDDAVRVVRDLNEQGCRATLDVLGEHVSNKEEAENAVSQYLEALDRLNAEALDCNISIKLTMLGLKLDKTFCLEKVRTLVERARELNNFVRIDMEDSSCTADTLEIYSQLREDFDNVGFVIQAYLRRSLHDIRDQMNGKTVNIRVCKGIYSEPRDIAFNDDSIINSNYMKLLRELLGRGHYVGIATHDEKLVWSAYDLTDELKLPRDQFEFQMLLGVDEQLRRIILEDGHHMRVYVPFGKQWYEYSTRRLKENPRIAGYVLKNLLGLRRS